jgi:hypothetical protein
MKLLLAFILLLVFPRIGLYAGEADVIKVAVKKLNTDTYRFDVTVSHNDAGWDHYANKWDVVGPDGTVFGTRTLYHPHVQEQPFTRSLSGVRIPNGISKVTVRAHDSVHKYGGKVAEVALPQQ